MIHVTGTAARGAYIEIQMSEREILKLEVARHARRVAEITAALEELQALAGDDDEAPNARQVGLLKMEMKGRSAAIALGSSRLKFLRD